MMETYRFYFLDGQGHIRQAPVVRQCANDIAAIDNAATIAAHEGEHAMEVWQGARLVHRRKASRAPAGPALSPSEIPRSEV